MSGNSTIMRDLQRAIRSELDRRNVALKVIAFKSGIPYSTLCSYFPGNERGTVEKEPAELPIGAVNRLCGAIPSDLLSLLLPDGYTIVRIPEGINHDELAGAMHDFLQAKERAHHPESEAGREIGPNEDATLRTKFTLVTGGRA